jgi:hypothetical protein
MEKKSTYQQQPVVDTLTAETFGSIYIGRLKEDMSMLFAKALLGLHLPNQKGGR